MTYERSELLTSKLISGSRKHNALHVLRKSENTEVQILKDDTCAPSLKTNLLIFVIILHCHINQLLCLKRITHCLLYDNMH